MAHPTRIFKTPDELEIAWKLYKEDLLVQAKDWQKVQYVGKEGQRMSDDLKLPYTMDGFEVFCYNNYGTVDHYFTNKEGYYTEFGTICSHIKKEIFPWPLAAWALCPACVVLGWDPWKSAEGVDLCC
jgi:hypothetical protein